MFVTLLFFLMNQPRTIGIMGAMDVEIILLKEAMQVSHEDTIANRIFTKATINEINTICVKAGIGKVNAAMTAELLIREYNVDAIIFTGVAGGINPDLRIGDIIISERVLHHDLGKITPQDFQVWDTLGYVADSTLIYLARQATERVIFDSLPRVLTDETYLPEVVTGIIATGDQFIASEKKRVWIEKTLKADCVEMEGAAVAQVCVTYGVPFVIIRSLSDLANESADVDFEAFVDYAARNSSRIVQEILRLLQE